MRLNAVLKPACSLALAATLLIAPIASVAQAPPPYLNPSATPLTVDRGSSALWQSLRKLHTRASLIMVVAHPDDEDGGMLAWQARGQGVDTSLLTLNRGEGGQNVMSSDYWDQLGLVRTEELLAAGQGYGVHQYWTRVTDFGFSKSLDEAMKTWGHDRVLYDVVRTIRMTRPLIVTSSFVGNVSDGHGHHQVSGEMAQEVFNAAADPKMFPDQIKAGLLPWAPLKVYARVPFARVTDKGIYDYATGHWEPVRFRNYVDNTWIEGIPSTTVEVPESDYNPLFGRSYLTVAREGLAMQKSQNGGIGAPVVKPFVSPYHLYASRVESPIPAHESDMFQGIDTTLAGIAGYAPTAEQAAWKTRLSTLSATVDKAISTFDPLKPAEIAPLLADGLKQTDALLAEVKSSKLPADAKYNMTHELLLKKQQFDDALGQSLGLSVLATVTMGKGGDRSGPMGDMSSQAGNFQTVIPGETFGVNLHVADEGAQPIAIKEARLASHAGEGWSFKDDAPITGEIKAGNAADADITATAPKSAELTKPYFTRPNLEQSFYDINDPRYLNMPTAPYPLSAEVTYTYGGATAHLSGAVQTVHRLSGPGPVFEPLLVAPAISVTLSPIAGVVPLANASLHLQVTVHSSVKGPAKGTLKLDLPKDWVSSPAVADFSMARDGAEQIVSFEVTPKSVQAKPYTITAVAQYNGESYKQGFVTTGYTGLRPYPFYRDASYRTTGTDVKVAPGLKVAYIMGPGDDVANSLGDLGIHPAFLSAQDVATADLAQFDAIILGIRAYAARPELKTFNNRLLDYTKNGGVVIVQYQTPEYDHNYGPYPLTLSADAEKVVEEDCKVTLLDANDPVLSWPNKITTADFNGWVEERGHGFMRSWDSHYTAVTEMHDVDQDPQKGGLLYAHYGKGAYVYLAYAFFREMPDGVPGAFRIMANLVSIAKNPNFAEKK